MTREQQLRLEAEQRDADATETAPAASADSEAPQTTMTAEERLRQEADARVAAANRPWYEKFYDFGGTGLKELGTGFVQGGAGSADIIPGTVNTATDLKDQFDSQGGDPYTMDPWFGYPQQIEDAVPVEPGWEGWRETGELYGGAITPGVVGGTIAGTPGGLPGMGAGAIIGGIGGAASATASLIGEKIGEQVDKVFPDEDQPRRWEKTLGFAGGFGPGMVKGGRGARVRSNYGDHDQRSGSAARSAAATRQRVPISLPLLGNESAQGTYVPPRVIQAQAEAMKRLLDRNAKGIAGVAPDATSQPLSNATVGEIGQTAQGLASQATDNAIQQREILQTEMETRAGGPDAIHDPTAIIETLQEHATDPRFTVEERAQWQGELDRMRANLTPRDAARHQRLQVARELAQREADRAPSASAAEAQQRLDSIDAEIESNLGINETMARRINSELKQVVQHGGRLESRDTAPVRDSIEQTRRDAAQRGGMTEAEWRRHQAQTAETYNIEETLDPRVRQGDLGPKGAYDYFFTAAGDQAPARLQMLQDANPAEFQRMLGRQYDLRTRGPTQDTISPDIRAWWAGLPEQAKRLRAPIGTQLRANLDDAALLSKNPLPLGSPARPSGSGAPLGNMMAGAVTGGATAGVLPLATRLLGMAGRGLMGDPAAELARNVYGDLLRFGPGGVGAANRRFEPPVPVR
jgi:hypothetical protein